MELSRRNFLAASTITGLSTVPVTTAKPGAPGVLGGASKIGYTNTELEGKIAKRDFRGLTKQDLPTPVLVLDQELFENNIRRMADHCKTHGLNLRSHVKVHRSADIGKQQIGAGAIGLCCATIAECEWMNANGISGLLWTAQPVGRNKISRVLALARKDPTFMCVLDNPVTVNELNDAAESGKINVRVVIDNDIGIGRQGVMPGQSALELAQHVMKAKRLQLAGLMGYSGAGSHTLGWENRKKISYEEVGKLLESVRLCRQQGIAVEIITGGSTGSYNIDSEMKALTELQADLTL